MEFTGLELNFESVPDFVAARKFGTAIPDFPFQSFLENFSPGTFSRAPSRT